MALFDTNEFRISAPQGAIHSPLGNGDVLDVVVRQEIEVTDVWPLPVFHITDHVKTGNISESVDKLADCELSEPRPCFNIAQNRN